MNVAELIAKLSKLPSNAAVWAYNDDGNLLPLTDDDDVRLDFDGDVIIAP